VVDNENQISLHPACCAIRCECDTNIRVSRYLDRFGLGCYIGFEW